MFLLMLFLIMCGAAAVTAVITIWARLAFRRGKDLDEL
jgi:hypothetical protein